MFTKKSMTPFFYLASNAHHEKAKRFVVSLLVATDLTRNARRGSAKRFFTYLDISSIIRDILL